MELLGLSLPPSGIRLLKEIEKVVDFEGIDIENIEEELQEFVGLNLLESIQLKKQKNS